MIKLIFYNLIVPLGPTIYHILPNRRKKKFLNWIINTNNKFVLSHKKRPKKIMLLIPKCLQNYECNNNVVNRIENCKMCGSCKIKNLLEVINSLRLKKEDIDISIKVATGGKIAKLYLDEYSPDYVIAVACDKELLDGIKETKKHNVLAVSNIIVEKPCINTDVEIKKIKEFLYEIIK